MIFVQLIGLVLGLVFLGAVIYSIGDMFIPGLKPLFGPTFEERIEQPSVDSRNGKELGRN